MTRSHLKKKLFSLEKKKVGGGGGGVDAEDFVYALYAHAC